MCLIYRLPSDLTVNLLLSWVSVEEVGRLDSATCNNTERRCFESLLDGNDFVFRNRHQPIKGRTDMFSKPHLFTTWLIKRKIAVEELMLFAEYCLSCGNIERYNYLRRKGRHIRKIDIRESVAYIEPLEALMAHVCESCPNLVMIECNVHLFWTPGTAGGDSLAFVQMMGAECQHRHCMLYSPHGFSNTELAILGDACPKLNVIGKLCTNVTDAGLASIARNGALTVLCTVYCEALTDAGLQAVAADCPLLEDVDLRTCHQLTDVTLFALGQHCHKLRTLRTPEFSTTGEGIHAIAAGCPLLEELWYNSSVRARYR
jgi:hypothetical protein